MLTTLKKLVKQQVGASVLLPSVGRAREYQKDKSHYAQAIPQITSIGIPRGFLK